MWGLVEPRFLDTERFDVAIPGLTGSWDGEQIALLSDWQIGMWLGNTATVRRAVAEAIEARPAAVLLAGDFVYRTGADPDDELRTLADLLRPLSRSGIPAFAVLGNHDFRRASPADPYDDDLAARVTATLEQAGVRVLRNDAAVVPRPANAADRMDPDARGHRAARHALRIVGIGSRLRNNSHPWAALDSLPPEAPRIVMMHSPRTFAELPAGSAPLAVAGHTHGGQVQIPFVPEWTLLREVTDLPSRASGWIRGYGAAGNQLYINRGIGFSRLPIRIRRPPELTLFTLRAATEPWTAAR